MICFGNCSFRPLHLSHLRDNPIWPWLHFWLRPWGTWVPLPGWSGTPYGNREFHSGRLAAAPGYWLKLRFYDTNYVALSTKNQAKSQLWCFMPVYSHVPIFSSQFDFFFHGWWWFIILFPISQACRDWTISSARSFTTLKALNAAD